MLQLGIARSNDSSERDRLGVGYLLFYRSAGVNCRDGVEAGEVRLKREGC